MNYYDLKELVAKGESSTLEFKRKIQSTAKIAKEISAFANTKGGCLLIGVDDDGTIRGIESEKSVIEQIEIACNFNLEPPVEYLYEIISVKKNKDIIAVYIDESTSKPHKLISDEEEEREFQRKSYIRIGEKSMIASREMARLLKSQNVDAPPLKISIGDNEKRLFAYLEEKERITVKDFARLVNISRRRAERLMIRLVRAGVIQINADSGNDYFTFVGS